MENVLEAKEFGVAVVVRTLEEGEQHRLQTRKHVNHIVDSMV